MVVVGVGFIGNVTDIKKPVERRVLIFFGAPGEIRTPDSLVRSQVLYPTELRAHVSFIKQRCFNIINGEGGIRTLDRGISPILP